MNNKWLYPGELARVMNRSDDGSTPTLSGKNSSMQDADGDIPITAPPGNEQLGENATSAFNESNTALLTVVG